MLSRVLSRVLFQNSALLQNSGGSYVIALRCAARNSTAQ